MKEYAERNHIEGKIGNAKQALSLNQLKAKLKETSQARIAATFFAGSRTHRTPKDMGLRPTWFAGGYL
ncbi:MAG: hypothetical protein ACLFQ0_14250 [Cyclobacteriaceae bacterium]